MAEAPYRGAHAPRNLHPIGGTMEQADWTTRPELVPGKIPEMVDRGRKLQMLKVAKDQPNGGAPVKAPAVYQREVR